MPEILKGIPLVKFEELTQVLYDGKPLTRELVESHPDIIRAIQNVYGINVDMTPPAEADTPSIPQ